MTVTLFCKACRGGPGMFHADCTGISIEPARGTPGTPHRREATEGPCPCAAQGHRSLRYATHGDPYSDPPRAEVCRRCGLLVGDPELHDRWHGVIDPFGCHGDRDHRWETQGASNMAGQSSRSWCRRCHAVHERVVQGGVVIRDDFVPGNPSPAAASSGARL